MVRIRCRLERDVRTWNQPRSRELAIIIGCAEQRRDDRYVTVTPMMSGERDPGAVPSMTASDRSGSASSQ